MNLSILPRSLIIRGIISLLFAAVAIALPGPTLLSIALLVGAYLFADGISALVTASHFKKRGAGWGAALLEGILGILAGAGAVLWPGITVLVLTAIAAVWALLTGAAELYGAFRIVWARKGARLLLGVAGVLSIALGAVMVVVPAIGVLTLLTMVTIYATLFGITTIAMGIQLRRAARSIGAQQPDLTRRAA
ncbi:MAG: HdeD family acid-resistance protein [Bdellovibrionota bacterium]